MGKAFVLERRPLLVAENKKWRRRLLRRRRSALRNAGANLRIGIGVDHHADGVGVLGRAQEGVGGGVHNVGFDLTQDRSKTEGGTRSETTSEKQF